MSDPSSRRSFLAEISAICGCVACSGCGSILHPERIGQPAGPIDWRIAALDGLGLVLFFIPGVIAFAVDFYNGTIFLPPGQYGSIDQRRQELVEVPIPQQELDRRTVQQVVSDHIGKPVSLESGRYETTALDDIEDFWSTEQGMHKGQNI